MDYKIIVILLVLLFLIILVYREITCLKENVDKNIVSASERTKHANDRYELTLQNSMDNYLGQIKKISTENLQQLKKITLLNHQPIIKKKISNHFTETDCSEVVPNDKIFNSQQNSHYYMSEETKNKNDNVSQYAEQSPQGIELRSDPLVGGLRSDPQGVGLRSDPQRNKISYKSGIPIYDESTDDSTDDATVEEVSSSSSSLECVGGICEIKQCDTLYVPNAQLDQSINEMIMNAQKLGNTIADSILEQQFGRPIFIEMHYDIESNKENVIESVESIDDCSINNVQNIIVCDQEHEHKIVTIEKEQEQNQQNDNNDQQASQDVAQPFVDKTLKHITEYTLNELKTMAKQMSIPTSYKHQNRTKQYKKEDLYNNIKAKF